MPRSVQTLRREPNGPAARPRRRPARCSTARTGASAAPLRVGADPGHRAAGADGPDRHRVHHHHPHRPPGLDAERIQHADRAARAGRDRVRDGRAAAAHFRNGSSARTATRAGTGSATPTRRSRRRSHWPPRPARRPRRTSTLADRIPVQLRQHLGQRPAVLAPHQRFTARRRHHTARSQFESPRARPRRRAWSSYDDRTVDRRRPSSR